MAKFGDVVSEPLNGNGGGGKTFGGGGGGGNGGGGGTETGTLAPRAGGVVADQHRGAGRYARGLVAKSFSLASARSSDDAKVEKVPGNVLHVLAAFGGAVPDDARIAIGDSGYFPVVEGFTYESDDPFDSYSLYWPTAAAGVTLWIVTALGRARRPIDNVIR